MMPMEKNQMNPAPDIFQQLFNDIRLILHEECQLAAADIEKHTPGGIIRVGYAVKQLVPDHGDTENYYDGGWKR